MKHPGHTYGGFVPAISERGMTDVLPVLEKFQIKYEFVRYYIRNNST
jgi:hypothetical protein